MFKSWHYMFSRLSELNLAKSLARAERTDLPHSKGKSSSAIYFTQVSA